MSRPTSYTPSLMHSTLTQVPVSDGNWKAMVPYATMDELRRAHDQVKGLTGHKSREDAIAREIRKRERSA